MIHAAMPRRSRRGGQTGFTLVELLVVIIILGILSAVVVFAVRGADDKGLTAAVATDRRTIRTALETYCAKRGEYPPMPDPEGILVNEEFLSAPSDYHDVKTGQGSEGNCAGGHYELIPLRGVPNDDDPVPPLPPPPGTWISAPNAVDPGTQPAAAAITLPDNKVLKIAVQLDEIFDPSAASGTGLWAPTTSQKDVDNRFWLAAAMLGGTKSETCPHCEKALLYIPGSTLEYGSLMQWSVYDPQSGERIKTGPTTWSRNYGAPIAVLAGSGPRCGEHCGKALTVGGGSGGGVGARTSAELYDPKTNLWSSTATLLSSGTASASSQSALVSLHDGTAMLINDSVQIFKPMDNDGPDRWEGPTGLTPYSGRNYNNFGHLVVLDDGRVLGVHNSPTPLAETYDPTTESWTPTTSCGCRGGTGLVLLKNGRVLLVGATEGTEPDGAAAYIYDSATEMWSRTGPLAAASEGGSATLLQDGRVLMVGGGGGTQIYTPG